TPATRAAFLHGGEAFVIWLDRIQVGTFADTNRMFVPPDRFDLRVTAHGPPEYWAEQAMMRLRPVVDPKKPTALFIGRYQPFHEGHRALIVEGLQASARPASQCATRKALTTKIRSISSTSRRASSRACANSKAGTLWCRYRTSVMCSTAATSATRSSASTLIWRSKTSPPRSSAEGLRPPIDVFFTCHSIGKCTQGS